MSEWIRCPEMQTPPWAYPGVDVDLRKIPEAVADFFIICQANNNIQLKAIADFIEEDVFWVDAYKVHSFFIIIYKSKNLFVWYGVRSPANLRLLSLQSLKVYLWLLL